MIQMRPSSSQPALAPAARVPLALQADRQVLRMVPLVALWARADQQVLDRNSNNSSNPLSSRK